MMLDYFYGQSGELFSYFRIPKALFQDHRFRQLSTDARTLYGILLDRMSLSVKNGWLDEQGRVYIIYTVREVQESLCCAEHISHNPAQVLKLAGKRYLTGPVIFYRTDGHSTIVSLTVEDIYRFQTYLESHSTTLMADDQKLTCICID